MGLGSTIQLKNQIPIVKKSEIVIGILEKLINHIDDNDVVDLGCGGGDGHYDTWKSDEFEQIINEAKKIIKDSKKNKCQIYGTGNVSFFREVFENDVGEIAGNIWKHPSRYSHHKDGSASSHCNFLKHLWIKFSNGRDIRLKEFLDETNA